MDFFFSKKYQKSRQFFAGILVSSLIMGILPPAEVLANTKEPEKPVKKELTEFRTANSKLIDNGNGTLTKQIFNEPTHRKVGEQWTEISTKLMKKSDLIVPQNTSINVAFESTMKQGRYAVIESGEHTLAYRFLEATGANKKEQAKDVSATFQDNKVTYPEVIPSVSVRNTVFNHSVKEDIVLSKYTGLNQYSFELNTSLTPVKQNDGSIQFEDKKKKVVFKLPAPYMYDSNVNPVSDEPAKSTNVEYDLKQEKNNWILTLSADEKWLQDPSRKYPVYIDPTTNVNTGVDGDTYVSDAYATTNYENSYDSSGYYSLKVGKYDATTGMNHAYIKQDLSSLSDVIVDSATFNIYTKHSASATPTAVYLDAVNNSWNPGTLTWNGATSLTSTNIGSASVAKDQWATFDVTSTVKAWLSSPPTKTNYGFKLHTNGNTSSTLWKKFQSSDNATEKPYLSVTYRLPVPEAPTGIAYSNWVGSDTGFVDLRWNPTPGATGYKVWMFNGKQYQVVKDVGNVTSWSTHNKGIWPTPTEIAAGNYLLHADGKGAELPLIPSPVYQNSGGTYGSSTIYYFRITAYRSLGESDLSAAFTTAIPARSEDLGTEEFWQFTGVPGGQVNAVTGNLVMSESDASTDGRGPGVSIGRTYNSRSTEDGVFGLGWSFNQAIKVTEDSKGNVIYTDQDGTVHQFTKNQDGTYTKPLGLYLDLVKDTTGFTITDKSQVKYIFDSTGKLSKVQDDDKNALTLTYNASNQLTSITDASGRATVITYHANGKIETVKDPGNRVWTYGYTGNLLTSVSNPENEVTKYIYTDNVITSVKEPSDTTEKPVETTYAYTDGRITSVQDTLKRTTTLAYDTTASKVTVTSPGQKVTEYYYNISGNPAKMVVDPGGLNLTTTYVYDHNNMVSTKDPNANKAGDLTSTESYKYDANGNVTEATDASGTEKMQYNSNNDVTQYTDSNNQNYKYVYDGTKEVSSTDPAKVSSANVYDANGNLVSSTKELGLAENLLTNSSFERSNPTYVTAPESWERALANESANYSLDSTTKVSGSKSLKLPTSSTSASHGFIAATQVVPVEPGATYTLSASIKTSLTNANAFLNTKQMDASMNDIPGTWADNRYSQLTGTNNWTKRQVSFTTGPNTFYVRVYLEVDHTNSSTSGAAWFDNVQLEKGAVSTSYNGLENSSFEDGFSYWTSSAGSPTIDATESFDGTQSVKMTQVTANTAPVQRVQYINLDQTTAQPITVSGLSKAVNVVNTVDKGPNKDYSVWVDAKDSSGNTIVSGQAMFSLGTHDWQRAATTIKPSTPVKTLNVYVLFRYNNTGTVWFDNIRVQDGSVISTNEYDANGNYVLKTTDPLGNSTQSTFDAVGNNLTSTDEKGNTKTYTYDQMDRTKSVALPGADVRVQYVHDKNGNVIEKKVTSKDGLTTYNSVKSKYDEDNQLVSSTDPLNKVTTYSYDVDGQQTKNTNPDQSTLEFSYDKAGRQTETKYNGTVRYKSTYDANGQEVQVEDVSLGQTKTRTFDKANRLTNMTTVGGSLLWGYDANDNLTEVKITNGTTNYSHTYGYNNINQNILITDPSGKKYRFDYDENGNVGTVVLGNGAGITTVYDENNQLTHMAIGKSNGDLIASYDYTYDKNGNRTSVKDHTGKLITYTYDEQNQLLSETDPLNSNTIHYTYDPVGNRKSKTVKDSAGNVVSSISYSYNAANQLVDVSGQAYTYSDNGTLTDDGTLLYIWDAKGRLTQVKKKSDNSTVAQYEYDEEDRRVRSTVAGVVTNYVYDGDSIRVLYETNASNQMTRYYTYSANGALLSITKVGVGTYYYHTNARGDVISITDGNNNTVASYTYDSWGNIVAKSGTLADENPYRYASYRYDNETGLYYLMARYYNAKNGNFLSLDPDPGDEDDIQTQNGYTYANNNPVNLVDPDGHWAFLIPLAIEGVAWGYGVYRGYKAAKWAYRGYKAIKKARKYKSWGRKVYRWGRRYFSGSSVRAIRGKGIRVYFSKGRGNRRDSGLVYWSDREVIDAYKKARNGKEKKRFEKEMKARGIKNTDKDR